jgi:hypothetical protein
MIDLFAGLGGWSHGGLAEGWNVVGIDIEEHVYGEHRYPAGLIIQDVLTVSGGAFSEASLIVASPPCQEYSYMAMPWTRAKAKAAAIRADTTGTELERLNRLFNACFRIQAEASLGAGRHIPMVVENVKGAQPWVGRARYNFGSFYLWGDVPALMPVGGKRKSSGTNWSDQTKRGQDFTRIAGRQAMEEEGLKVPGFRFDGSGRSFQSASVEGLKSDGGSWFGDYGTMAEGVKQRGSGREWFAGDGKISRMTSSKSPARKFASAMIAKIPEPLSRHIARTFWPLAAERAA